MAGDDSETASEELMDEAEAMAMWERHLESATDRWHEGVRESAEEYREGLAEGLGVEPEDVPDEAVEHWQESVMETGPDEFAASITGEGTDWFTGLYEKATGEQPPQAVEDAARDVKQEALDRVGDDASDEEIANAVRQAVRRRSGDATEE
ncbi:hypothetical protein [Halorussus sp. MSC15.2]|uniref:hypothetical protein n=1 Tax=Halorussus sp. MSC15.2 TaxID=2283638 RepID=UPI0013D6100C|nr:hypothetical protein [Halorussus sp. MSC15.2]NEU57485.1 hypothetical protein [Halorussus sp. MSC15.2]